MTDGDSVTMNTLCNSANGTFVTLDDYLPDTQYMEETSRRSVLGRHQSCFEERIAVLSDSIECNHPSRNTSSLLYSKSCQIENWRSLKRKSIHVTSTSAQDLIDARMEKRIGFRTCSTTRRRSCSTSKIFPTNPTNSKSNS